MKKTSLLIANIPRQLKHLKAQIAVALLVFAGAAPAWAADCEFDIEAGAFTGGNTGCAWVSPTLTITGSGTVLIHGTGTATTHQVIVNGGTSGITLNNVNIDVSSLAGLAAFAITGGANVTLTLESSNTLKSGSNRAGLEVNASNALTITAASTSASLTTQGSDAGAGIGGAYNNAGGDITINNGSIVAESTYGGAGIGGGLNFGNGSVTITGGIVVARSLANGGAGIGGGNGGDGGTINISGGIVTAISLGQGSGAAAGIGGGSRRSAGFISISGGTILAQGGTAESNTGAGAGIGGGGGFFTAPYGAGDGGVVTITGGSILAIRGPSDPSNPAGDAMDIGGGGCQTGCPQGAPATLTNGQGTNVYLNTLTVGSPDVGTNKLISAATIDGTNAALIPNALTGVYGITDVYTRSTGKLYFYIPALGNSKEVTATTGGQTYAQTYNLQANHNNAATLILAGGGGGGGNTVPVPALSLWALSLLIAGLMGIGVPLAIRSRKC